eukprot:13409175-Heterocapsa_arctica.AAC.1
MLASGTVIRRLRMLYDLNASPTLALTQPSEFSPDRMLAESELKECDTQVRVEQTTTRTFRYPFTPFRNPFT